MRADGPEWKCAFDGIHLNVRPESIYLNALMQWRVCVCAWICESGEHSFGHKSVYCVCRVSLESHQFYDYRNCFRSNLSNFGGVLVPHFLFVSLSHCFSLSRSIRRSDFTTSIRWVNAQRWIVAVVVFSLAFVPGKRHMVNKCIALYYAIDKTARCAPWMKRRVGTRREGRGECQIRFNWSSALVAAVDLDI